MDPLIIRSESVEKITVNTYMPLEGEPILSPQGKELNRQTLVIASDKPLGISSAGGAKIYSKDYSGVVLSSVSEIKYGGTPYISTTVVAIG